MDKSVVNPHVCCICNEPCANSGGSVVLKGHGDDKNADIALTVLNTRSLHAFRKEFVADMRICRGHLKNEAPERIHNVGKWLDFNRLTKKMAVQNLRKRHAASQNDTFSTPDKAVVSLHKYCVIIHKQKSRLNTPLLCF